MVKKKLNRWEIEEAANSKLSLSVIARIKSRRGDTLEMYFNRSPTEAEQTQI